MSYGNDNENFFDRIFSKKGKAMSKKVVVLGGGVGSMSATHDPYITFSPLFSCG